MSDLLTPFAGTHPTANFIDGANAPVNISDAGEESLLDFSLAYPIIYPQKITLFQTDDLYYTTEVFTGGLFNTFLDAIDGSYCNYIDRKSLHVSLLRQYTDNLQPLIPNILITRQEAIKGHCSVECTAQQMSFQFPMVSKKRMFPSLTKQDSATNI
jgi:hypothetical protein